MQGKLNEPRLRNLIFIGGTHRSPTKSDRAYRLRQGRPEPVRYR